MLDAETVNATIHPLFPGMRAACTAIGADFAVATIEVDEGSIRPGGFVSGPTQFALADTALWFLVFGAIGRVEPMALTAELSIRYLRPAVGTRLSARAALDAAGRRNVVGTVKLWTDDEHRPCSVAQGTYALPSSQPPGRSPRTPRGTPQADPAAAVS